MEQSMKNSGILLTINLKGALIGQPIHNQLQEVKVDISPDPKKIIYTTQRICHVDRISVACHKKTLITEEAVTSWRKGDCPYWERPAKWKSMTDRQKIESHLSRFDEGYGYSYEFVEE